jgi:RHS repeat-associated protein
MARFSPSTLPAGAAPALNLTQTYSYDSLNRLETASETAGGGTAWTAITYGMDRYGNRWVQSGYKPAPTFTPQAQSEFNAATNRMVSPSGYDNAGNLVVDKVGRSFKYDAENHQAEFNPNVSGIPATTYAYDAEGRRVKKSDGTNTTLFVYNAAGQLLAEYTTQPASGVGGISYLSTDHLGSTRLVTTNGPTVKTRHDYLPYGEEIDVAYGGRGSIPGYTATLLDGPNQKFTAKERDNESNLDYFGARYFSGAQGRFTSPDSPSYANRKNPQSWNLYTYALNNPVTFADADGHEIVCANNAEQCRKDAAAATGNTEAAKRVSTTTTTTQHSMPCDIVQAVERRPGSAPLRRTSIAPASSQSGWSA